MTGWFNYQMVEQIVKYSYTRIIDPFGDYLNVDIIKVLSNFLWLDNLLVPIAYFFELSIFAVVFDFRLLLVYLPFFVCFHLMTKAVGILFFGNLFVLVGFFLLYLVIKNRIMVTND